jgi:quinolinate synthase
MESKDLIEKINNLKKEKNAVILVHNYQRPEIYEIADHIGDSLDLSKKAASTNAAIIVFCGVTFMAETAKVLSPDKKVLIPEKTAGCPLADSATVTMLRQMKRKHPGAAVVSYVNTSALVKAESDICCTSVNAVKIVNSLKEDEVIFIPDVNLGKYVQSKTNKKIVLWPGHCHVHSAILAENIKEAKKQHPYAKVVAHPEAPPEVLALADFICGTGGMIKYAKESKAKEFIIVTEEGMINRLKREVPHKTFYVGAGVCFNMKKTTLEKVYNVLLNETNEIILDKKVMDKARIALQRMLDVS